MFCDVTSDLVQYLTRHICLMSMPPDEPIAPDVNRVDHRAFHNQLQGTMNPTSELRSVKPPQHQPESGLYSVPVPVMVLTSGL